MAGQGSLYSVVTKPSPQAATAANHVVGSASPPPLTSGEPHEVTGYQVERINKSAEQSPEVHTPPRTEEMDILVEDKTPDFESVDDTVYEIVD